MAEIVNKRITILNANALKVSSCDFRVRICTLKVPVIGMGADYHLVVPEISLS